MCAKVSKERDALREELRKYKEEDDVWMKSSLVDLSKDRDRLREELAQVKRRIAELEAKPDALAAFEEVATLADNLVAHYNYFDSGYQIAKKIAAHCRARIEPQP